MKHEFKMYVGPMFGGKTTRMLSQLERYRFKKEDIILFKPDMDKRYDGVKSVVTHTGLRKEAMPVKTGVNILRTVSSIFGTSRSVIAVDEAFMIPGSGKALVYLFKQGHTILVSTLQLSSGAEPYEEIQEMFPWATEISVCPAVCPVTGEDAFYTEKIAGKSEHLIEIGGAELYQPRCFQKYFGFEE